MVKKDKKTKEAALYGRPNNNPRAPFSVTIHGHKIERSGSGAASRLAFLRCTGIQLIEILDQTMWGRRGRPQLWRMMLLDSCVHAHGANRFR